MQCPCMQFICIHCMKNCLVSKSVSKRYELYHWKGMTNPWRESPCKCLMGAPLIPAHSTEKPETGWGVWGTAGMKFILALQSPHQTFVCAKYHSDVLHLRWTKKPETSPWIDLAIWQQKECFPHNYLNCPQQKKQRWHSEQNDPKIKAPALFRSSKQLIYLQPKPAADGEAWPWKEGDSVISPVLWC